MKSVAMYPALALAVLTLLDISKQVSTQQEVRPGMEFANITGTRYIEILAKSQSRNPIVPRSVYVGFLLFTRQNPRGYNFLGRRGNNLRIDTFDPTRNTIMIIHGFLGRARLEWIELLTTLLLKVRDINVITVDWSNAAVIPYTRAVRCTPLVAGEVIKFLNFLFREYGAKPWMFHLIGHSLGAQIAGYAGERIYKLGRITGLDPAAPFFIDLPDASRLDPTDANFVDVIHTNSDGLGAGWTCGHVDFYPNGGKEQPGCAHADLLNSDIVDVVQSAICSHKRSVDLFIESVLTSNDTCQFVGRLCDSYDNYLAGKCNVTPLEKMKDCIMGLDADKYAGINTALTQPRKFYLNTYSSSPYCARRNFF